MAQSCMCSRRSSLRGFGHKPFVARIHHDTNGELINDGCLEGHWQFSFVMLWVGRSYVAEAPALHRRP
jgi:hypothetical protein